MLSFLLYFRPITPAFLSVHRDQTVISEVFYQERSREKTGKQQCAGFLWTEFGRNLAAFLCALPLLVAAFCFYFVIVIVHRLKRYAAVALHRNILALGVSKEFSPSQWFKAHIYFSTERAGKMKFFTAQREEWPKGSLILLASVSIRTVVFIWASPLVKTFTGVLRLPPCHPLYILCCVFHLTGQQELKSCLTTIRLSHLAIV